MEKKYKDMTPEERAALKAANEAEMAKFEAAQPRARSKPLVKDAAYFRDLAAAQARDRARNDRISGYTHLKNLTTR